MGKNMMYGAIGFGESCDVWWFFEVDENGQGWEGENRKAKMEEK